MIDGILNKYEDDIFEVFESDHTFDLLPEDKVEVNKLHKIFYELDKINQKLNVFFKNYNEHNRWILKPTSGKSMFLSPYRAAGLFDEYLSVTARRFKLMSATIGDPNEFIKEFGLIKGMTASISVDSEFDPQLSPIIYSPVGKMNYESIEQTLPFITSTVKKIISEFHPNDKGIIHTTNYRIADHIYNTVKDERLIYAKRTEGKISNQEMFSIHENNDNPSVLLSPSLGEGVSLDDDLSRFQIIVKLPFLSIDNIRTKIKMKEDSDWYINKMWISLCQSCGRSTRSKDDYSVTYILDSSFLYFFKRYKKRLPKWFVERVIV
jgi:Rad3-related DNA helicase